MPEDTNATPTVDMAAIQAEIGKLSTADLAAELTKVRVRQKKQQKKQYAKGTMKAYQQKAAEKRKLMKELALHTKATLVDPRTNAPYPNLWEQIQHVAEVQAEKELENEAIVPGEVEDEPTDENAA